MNFSMFFYFFLLSFFFLFVNSIGGPLEVISGSQRNFPLSGERFYSIMI